MFSYLLKHTLFLQEEEEEEEKSVSQGTIIKHKAHNTLLYYFHKTSNG
jgi:hypothetical protein